MTTQSQETMKDTILTAIQVNGPINRKELLIQTNDWIEMFSTERKISDRKLRERIVELIKDGHAIASSEQGYFIIKTLAQAIEARDYMRKPLEARAVRANMILGNFNATRQNGTMINQLKIF